MKQTAGFMNQKEFVKSLKFPASIDSAQLWNKKCAFHTSCSTYLGEENISELFHVFCKIERQLWTSKSHAAKFIFYFSLALFLPAKGRIRNIGNKSIVEFL